MGSKRALVKTKPGPGLELVDVPEPVCGDRDGAFADYVVIPATNAWVQPPDLDPDLGALFDPLGNATTRHSSGRWWGRTSSSPAPARSG